MNYKMELVKISSLSVHPIMEKYGRINKEAYKKYIPSIKEFGFMEPIRIVKKNKRSYIINGISRYRAACDVGVKTVPVVETSPIESDVFLDSIIRNTSIKRSYKEVAVATSYILDWIGKSQGKKRTKVPVSDDIDNFGEVAKNRYDLAGTILHIDLSVSSLQRLIKIHEIDETPEGSKLKLFDLLESGKGILPVYKIAIETDESRTRKYNRLIELEQEKEDKIKQAGSIKEHELTELIRSKLQKEFEKEYEERFEKEFGCKPKPKSLLDLEWDGKINKFQLQMKK